MPLVDLVSALFVAAFLFGGIITNSQLTCEKYNCVLSYTYCVVATECGLGMSSNKIHSNKLWYFITKHSIVI